MDRMRTGIDGLDGMLCGGLPRGRTAIIEGGPGSGKTTLCLQILAGSTGAGDGQAGIFVAFEESCDRIRQAARNFGWHLDKHVTFIDAQPEIDAVYAGDFSLEGLLAALSVQVEATGASRVVFDAPDVMLSLLDQPSAARRELYRLHKWLSARELTALITAKQLGAGANATQQDILWTSQYLMDCHIRLFHDTNEGISQRGLQVAKLRGAGFDENIVPLVIDQQGMELASLSTGPQFLEQVSSERLSTGIQGLDRMIDGGYFRGSAVLVSGAPGTAKTTLAGGFAAAACTQGERVLYVSFDSAGEEVVRNLRSVSIDLAPAQEDGSLSVLHLRAVTESAERHLLTVRKAATALGASCIILDPSSALHSRGNEDQSRSVILRLIAWAKANSITVFATSLLERGTGALDEGTDLNVSTIADTWIHLSYATHAGERNRALSIVKARGTKHSNQVRELILASDGVSLAPVYAAEGEVFMGSLRAQKEAKQAEDERRIRREAAREAAVLRSELADLEAKQAKLEKEIDMRRADLEQFEEEGVEVERKQASARQDRLARRGGDAAPGAGVD